MREKILSILKKFKIEKLTEVQEKAFSPIYEGKDCLIISPTGTGKTLAALLPIFERWLEEKPKPTSILYVSPMKALNRDQLDHLLFWSEELGMEISVRHGDTSSYERRLQAEFANDFLILTNEALQTILVGKKIREHLKNVKWVILDEVHEIVESKRGVQLTLALERLRELAKDFQVIMLSATIGEPEKIASFFSSKRVEIICVKYKKPLELKVVFPKEEKIDEKISEKILTMRESSARLRFILQMVKDRSSTLVFTNTREFAEILASRLRLIEKDLPVAVHHSSLSKEVRVKTEKEFKEGKIKALVCTSSLQLGVDIGAVDLVLQYQSPREVVQLLQRVGRSGHKFWMKSEGIIIATDEDDILEAGVIVRKALRGELEKIYFHRKSLDVLAHQLVGIVFDFNGEVEIDKAFEVVRRAEPFKDIKLKEFFEVVKFLEDLEIIFVRGTKIVKRRKAYDYYFSRISTIPDVKEYRVINTLDGSIIGSLDEEFVTLYGEEGSVFILKGESYKILSIENDKIYVEPSKEKDAAIPSWEGELIPVPLEVALEVGELRKKISEGNLENLKEVYKIDENSLISLKNFYEDQKKKFVPSDKEIFIEFFDNKVIIHSSFGNKVNETLSKFIIYKLNVFVKNRNDAYRIILIFPEKVDKSHAEKIKEILEESETENLESELDSFISRTDLFLLRFLNVAKRFGVIEKDASIGKNLARKLIEEFSNSPVYKETINELKTEKLDLKNCKEILEKIKNGEIKLFVVEGPSRISKLALRKVFVDFIEEPNKDVLEFFRERIMEKKVKLICINCGNWSTVYALKELPDNIFCKICGARLLTIVREDNHKSERIISKYLRKIHLTKEEKKEFNRLLEKATLFLSFGRKAAIAFSVRGIGTETAKKILAKYFRNEEEFFEELYDAQKNFIKTRKFWKI
ncbi:MAG: DEAD/DEAH box helicase [Candidatus Aenigmatarchaeota archaeon]